MKFLPEFLHQPGFESITSYLSGGDEAIKEYELADRIADTFDQYLLYRPEMVLRWERGEERHWQAILWRALVHETGPRHRAAYGEDLLKGLQRLSKPPEGLPRRVSLFGISSLPRFHLAVLDGISPWVDVHLYLLNPCQEYWGDILSDKEIARIQHGKGLGTSEGLRLHFEEGNSLLASMGTMGREFFDLVQDFDPEETTSFVDPGEGSWLTRLQKDILYLKEKPEEGEGLEPYKGEDDSLQIHSCHSPMREMEVLHDNLLAMFEGNPHLTPRDIVVMTPDIDIYAPYIQAVFDAPQEDPCRIPFTLSDRTMADDNEIAGPLLSILGLSESRLGAEEVVELLQFPLLGARFKITEGDIEFIRAWLREAAIRWGMDSVHREEIGLPPEEGHTWRSGLDRLLLGYAMSGTESRLFQGILPYEGIEGGMADVLSRFLGFLDHIFYYASHFKRPRTLSAWGRALSDLLEVLFFVEGRSERDIQTIRSALQSLSEMESISGMDREVSIRVIRQYLSQFFKQEGYGTGFMAGGVTFCAMLPMRSIPFEVVCLVGMNNDVYPRKTTPPSFDLISENPRPGDRSRRKDDRYLFLEAILAARTTLYISYVGQNIRDNSAIPPSVLVSEFQEYVEDRFRISGGDGRECRAKEHRLHGFSPEYYRKEGTLFSFSRQNYHGARVALSPRVPAGPLILEALSKPDESWRTVDLEDFCRFYSNPAKWLLQKRLGIFLEEDTSILEETEPFDLKGLERYQMAQELLESKIDGNKGDDLFTLFRAAGRLPHGVAGKCFFDELTQGVEGFADRLKPYLEKPSLKPLDVDLSLGAFQLVGKVDQIQPDYLVIYRYARLKPKDFLRAWISHGALCTSGPETYPKKTLLIGLDPKGRKFSPWSAWRFDPVAEGDGILSDLLAFYWRGLVLPLPFFSETSWAYGTERFQKGKSVEEGMKRALKKWESGEFMNGERDSNPYYRICFKDTDPLGVEFCRLSERILEPLMKSLRKEGR
jgi:exodeoxyribonuclease V gamma subunit